MAKSRRQALKTIITLATTATAALLCGCGGGDINPPSAPAGMIDQLEIVSTVDAYSGATPAGAAGPYSVITGIVHGKLNPSHPDNAGIVDLANAPVGADGYVSYTTDVVILRPKAAANARRVLFYDVVNRGNKLARVERRQLDGHGAIEFTQHQPAGHRLDQRRTVAPFFPQRVPVVPLRPGVLPAGTGREH